LEPGIFDDFYVALKSTVDFGGGRLRCRESHRISISHHGLLERFRFQRAVVYGIPDPSTVQVMGSSVSCNKEGRRLKEQQIGALEIRSQFARCGACFVASWRKARQLFLDGPSSRDRTGR